MLAARFGVAAEAGAAKAEPDERRAERDARRRPPRGGRDDEPSESIEAITGHADPFPYEPSVQCDAFPRLRIQSGDPTRRAHGANYPSAPSAAGGK